MEKVLIVEDDMILSGLLEIMVTRLGYEVVGKVSSGKDAIETTRKLKPDIIMMDIFIEGDLNGIETMEIINTISGTPFFYLTGNSDPDTRNRALKTKPHCILIKPVEMAKLKETLLTVIPKKLNVFHRLEIK